MKISHLLIGTILIFILIFFIIAINELAILNILNKRVKDAMIFSAWAAFSDVDNVDLDVLAVRHNIDDEENRDIVLDKNNATEIVKKFLKENLKLNDSYYPQTESFLNNKDYPIIINDIEIYNPADLPNIAPNGVNVKETSIYINIQFPVKIKFYGDAYKKVDVVVDTKTFYSLRQNKINKGVLN